MRESRDIKKRVKNLQTKNTKYVFHFHPANWIHKNKYIKVNSLHLRFFFLENSQTNESTREHAQNHKELNKTFWLNNFLWFSTQKKSH